jgi:hypothetical protein
LDNLSANDLAELILLTNYLNNQGLLDMCAAALHFKVKEIDDAEKIRNMFSQQEDVHNEDELKKVEDENETLKQFVDREAMDDY